MYEWCSEFGSTLARRRRALSVRNDIVKDWEDDKWKKIPQPSTHESTAYHGSNIEVKGSRFQWNGDNSVENDYGEQVPTLTYHLPSFLGKSQFGEYVIMIYGV